jgi:prepilin-type N-terminal cleavage/methylation domain-containing protein
MQRRGFTIIELLVVIVMIGLLTSAAVASYTSAQRRSRDSARKSQVTSIATAVETYYTQHHSFPGQQMLKNPTSTPLASLHQDCEAWTGFTNSNSADPNVGNYDGWSYMYSPTQDASACNARIDPHNTDPDSTTNKIRYDIASFNPAPAWIPGLGDYLSPFPVEKNYIDPAGGSVAAPTDFLCTSGVGACGPAGNSTRTLVYRPLMDGFLVYARLESNTDSDSAKDADLAVGANLPYVPTGLNTVPSGVTMFLIRR